MEVYGTKPKIFTKEWWPYFWDYYKFHTIGIAFVVIAIIVTVGQCKNKKNYDLQIDVITENSISQDAWNTLLGTVCDNIEDVTENGKTEAYISFLDMRENVDPGVSEVMYSKLVVEVGYSEAFVFIVSQKFADYLSNEGILKPASDWTDMESYNGYCISLENCKVLEDIGIDTSDLYIGITELRERDGKSARDKNIPKQENGIKFAKFLLDKR